MTTKIEWCAMPGYKPETWNPVTGCTQISEGCANCYAKRLIGRNLHGYDFTPRMHADRLSIPKHWKMPRFIFVCSMGDLFHEDVPFDFVSHVMAVAALHPRHIFVLLTKRAERMRQYFDLSTDNREEEIGEIMRRWTGGESSGLIELPLLNVWAGVTAENQKRADEHIPVLLQIPAAVRFVSVEPTLSAVDLTAVNFPTGCCENVLRTEVSARAKRWGIDKLNGIDWVICGGESGPGARPMHPAWPRSLLRQCHLAGVPYFFKQHGAWIPKRDFPLKPNEVISPTVKWGVLNYSGEFHESTTLRNEREGFAEDDYEYMMLRVGKKAAGRLLDGREWNELPTPAQGEEGK